VYGTKNVTELRETVIVRLFMYSPHPLLFPTLPYTAFSQWYAGMRDVFAEVVIMWNNANSAETENVRSLARSETPRYARVRVVTPTLLGFEGTNTPNHRYLPIPACTTWGVFSVESGLRLTSSTIRRGFRGWQQHMTAVVGYRFETRRMLSKPERVAAGGDLLSSNSPLNTKMLMPPSCPRASQTPFNLVLPAAVFFHNRYLQAFTYGSDVKGLQSVRLLVDASRAGADLVFPIVASLVGNRGPVVVEEDEADSIIPARSVALRAADDMEQLIELFENAQANHSLDGLMKPALGLFWKFGEPRPVPCS
jgi:Glycosyl transferase family 64 domain